MKKLEQHIHESTMDIAMAHEKIDDVLAQSVATGRELEALNLDFVRAPPTAPPRQPRAGPSVAGRGRWQ
eukprot:7796768-Pyramimonas_sp.AAC.1